MAIKFNSKPNPRFQGRPQRSDLSVALGLALLERLTSFEKRFSNCH